MNKSQEQPEVTPARIGKLVYQAMEQANMNQSDLARAIGAYPPDISNIVRGKKMPTLQVLARIAKALDMRLRDLIDPDW